jgi:hypothetical protein
MTPKIALVAFESPNSATTKPACQILRQRKKAMRDGFRNALMNIVDTTDAKSSAHKSLKVQNTRHKHTDNCNGVRVERDIVPRDIRVSKYTELVRGNWRKD